MFISFGAFVLFVIQNFIHVQGFCSGSCPGSPPCIDMQMCSGPPYHPTCGAPLPICSIPSAPVVEVAPSEGTPTPVVVVPTQEPPLEVTSVTPSVLGAAPSGQPGTTTGTNTSPNSNTPPPSSNTPGTNPQPSTKPPTNTNSNISPTGNTQPPNTNTPSANTNQPSGTPSSPNTPATNPQPSIKPPTNSNSNISPIGNTPPPNTNTPPPNTNPPPANTNPPSPNTSPPSPNTNPPPANTNPPSQPPPNTNPPSQPPPNTNPQPSTKPPANTNSNISPIGNTPPQPTLPPPQSSPPTNTNSNISPVGNTPPQPTSQPTPAQSSPPTNTNSNISPVGNTPPQPTSQPTPAQPVPPQSSPPTNTNSNISPISNTPPSTNPTQPATTGPTAGGNVPSGKPGVSVNCGEMVKTCNDGNHVIVTVSVPVNGGKTPAASSTNASGRIQRDENNANKDFNFCPVTFKRKGCYKDKHDGVHPLPELLFTDRDSSSKVFSGTTISSKDWGNYIMKLICRCAEQANQNRFALFGIQHYGDCWSGMQSSINNYESQGISKACIARDQSPCEEDSAVCVGEDGANFVYELTGGPGPEKKNKIVHKKTRIKLAKSKQARNHHALKKHLQKFKKSFHGLRRLKRPH